MMRRWSVQRGLAALRFAFVHWNLGTQCSGLSQRKKERASGGGGVGGGEPRVGMGQRVACFGLGICPLCTTVRFDLFGYVFQLVFVDWLHES